MGPRREEVFCGMWNAEYRKSSRGQFLENSMWISFCGMKGKVRNESMCNVTEMNIY